MLLITCRLNGNLYDQLDWRCGLYRYPILPVVSSHIRISLRPHVSHTIVDSRCSIVGEIRLNADGFHSSHHLTFSYAICGHVDAYNQVYSPEPRQRGIKLIISRPSRLI